MSEYRKHFEKIYRLTSVQAENEFQQKNIKNLRQRILLGRLPGFEGAA